MDVLSVIGALTQESRVLKLKFGGADAPAKNLLLPYRLRLNWSLSEPYSAWLICVSENQALELKTFLGQSVGIGIRQPSGERQLTGLVTAARLLGVDGGLSACALRVQPGLALLAQRRTSRVFQDRSVPDIVGEIVQEHLAANTAMAGSMRLAQQLRRTHSPRSMCTQYEESDLDFIHRLLAEEGINYTFRFQEGDAGPLHEWVLFDDAMDLPASGVSRLGYRQSVDSIAADAILAWQGERRIITARTSLASYDYKPAQQQEANDVSSISQGESGAAASATLEEYQPLTHYYASSQAELDQYARLRQQAHDLRAKTFYGAGTATGLEVGEWFTLDRHPAHAGDDDEHRQFVVTAQWLDVASNPSAGLAGKLPGDLASVHLPGEPDGELAALTTDTDNHPALQCFSAVRRGIALLPAWAGELTRPTARGSLTGTVVGQEGDTVHTDELGRVKVQLRFPRSQEHPRSGAGYDDKSSTFLRVKAPYAGEGFGHQFLPRVGDEVVVDFLYGDIDRPYVSGLLYGGSRPTPQFSGVTGLPGNRTLSGIQTREHSGSNTNELLFDDTPAQSRTRLATTHASSELNLGYLAHPRKNGEADPRGEGAELRTDGAAALRAAQGLLLTTAAQVGANGPHLEREALLQTLAIAQDLIKSLAEAATQQEAESADERPLEGLREAMANWDAGSNLAPDGHGGGAPAVAVYGDAGMVMATPKSLTTAVGETADFVADQIQQVARKRLLMHAGELASLFVQGAKQAVASLRLVAARGNVEVAAHDGDLKTSASGAIRIEAGTETVITVADGPLKIIGGDGSLFKMEGGNVDLHCPGTFTVKASVVNMDGGSHASVAQNAWPATAFNEQFQARFDNGNVARNWPYEIVRGDGARVRGTTDGEGLISLQQGETLEGLELRLLPQKTS